HRALKKCRLCSGSCRLREGRDLGQEPAQVRVVPGFDTSRRQTTANQIGCRLALRLYSVIARQRTAMSGKGFKQKLLGRSSLYLRLNIHFYPYAASPMISA